VARTCGQHRRDAASRAGDGPRAEPKRLRGYANGPDAHNDREKNIQVDRLGEASQCVQFLDCLTKVRARREKQNSDGFEARVTMADAHEGPATGSRGVEDQHGRWRLPHGSQTTSPVTGNLYIQAGSAQVLGQPSACDGV
jgi:hypothetical protein